MGYDSMSEPALNRCVEYPFRYTRALVSVRQGTVVDAPRLSTEQTVLLHRSRPLRNVFSEVKGYFLNRTNENSVTKRFVLLRWGRHHRRCKAKILRFSSAPGSSPPRSNINPCDGDVLICWFQKMYVRHSRIFRNM